MRHDEIIFIKTESFFFADLSCDAFDIQVMSKRASFFSFKTCKSGHIVHFIAGHRIHNIRFYTSLIGNLFGKDRSQVRGMLPLHGSFQIVHNIHIHKIGAPSYGSQKSTAANHAGKVLFSDFLLPEDSYDFFPSYFTLVDDMFKSL